MQKRVLLGYMKHEFLQPLYLENFTWDCGWYWGGGYLSNRLLHCHFDNCFLDVPDRRGHPLGPFYTPWDGKGKEPHAVILQNGSAMWEGVETFLDRSPIQIKENWWRIKDLFRQFYAHKQSAECFKYGGHVTSKERTEGEINLGLWREINLHILENIIPEIHIACGFYENKGLKKRQFIEANRQLIPRV